MAGKSTWDQANRRQKLDLVWRIRKKISQIIKDYFYLPFFLFIILCSGPSLRQWTITSTLALTATTVSPNFDREPQLGLGISNKKIIPRKTEHTEQMVISDGIPAVPRKRNSRNSVPNPSVEEKTTRNSVPWTKNRSKISKFPSEPLQRKRTPRNSVPWNRNKSKISEFSSEPFRGRENNSEFRSVELKQKNSRNSVPNYSAEEKTTRNKTRQRQSLTVFKLMMLQRPQIY